jgi:hypothetical protein
MTMTTTRFVMLAVLALGLSACKPAEEEKPAAAPVVALTAPKGTDNLQWQAFIQQEIAKHDDGVTERVYPYYLAMNSQTPDTSDGSSPYARQKEQVFMVVQRTVLPGNMLAFGSPDSTKMADLIIEAFKDAKPDALKGSNVLFIGSAADTARVEAAVRAAGAGYIFVEAK